MTTDNLSPITSSTNTGGTTSQNDAARRAQDRAKLASLAAEFESMLTMSMLRDMRTSGRWTSDGESADTLGAETFDSTFDQELSRYLSQSRGFGLSDQLMRVLDRLDAEHGAGTSAALADSLSPATTSGGTASRTSSRASTSTGYSGRMGWNGLHLDPPPSGNSGAQWAGFNADRAMAGTDDNSIKDAFYRWTQGLSFNPAGKGKAAIGEFLRANVDSAREYGINVLDVDGDKMLVETAESGPEWVDVVAGAGSDNPSETKWQWLCQSEYGVPIGGGALGDALSSLRSTSGGAEMARTVLADGGLIGDALTARLQTAAADARSGRTTPTTPRTWTTEPPTLAYDTPATAADGLRTPTAYVTSGYGWRQDPITGATRFHRGVDLRAASGSDVASTGAGRVTFSGNDGAYGTTVVVEHNNGLSTRYAHLQSALVNLGDEVQEGQTVGLAGQTGRATGPHVHYEVIADGRSVDPLR